MLLIALSIFFAACTSRVQSLDLVQRLAEKEVGAGNIVGVSLAASRERDMVWEASFGLANVERGIKASFNTLFSLASISKPFTATALMVLVERGEIDLDRPINDYLGEAKLRGSPGMRYEPSVREIAGHVGGLGLHWHFFPENSGLERPSMDETIQRFGFLCSPPGERYEYSNLGYGVLEYIIERVSGRSYAEFLRTEVLDPLGLGQTSVPLKHNDRLAVRHWNDGTAVPFYDFDHRGASAVYSSASDLIRFGMYHLGLLDLGAKAPVSPKGLAEMQRSIARLGAGGYGLGWGLNNLTDGTPMIAHSGGMAGVSTMLTLFPEQKIVIVALANNRAQVMGRLHEQLRSAMVPDYRDAGKENAEAVFTGVCEGEITTADRAIPLKLLIDEPLNCDVQIEEGEMQRVSEAVIGDDNWIGGVETNLRIPGLPDIDHDLQLVLKRRGARLNGRATVIISSTPETMPAAPSFSADLRLLSDFVP
jgi:CubicO group peptidase (beta-lactamase class C family)